jgi:hypothetical protein
MARNFPRLYLFYYKVLNLKEYANKEIAQEFHLSTYTVNSHIHNILEKLALHTRVLITKKAHTYNDYTAGFRSISLNDGKEY